MLSLDPMGLSCRDVDPALGLDKDPDQANFLKRVGSGIFSDRIWIRHIFWADPDQEYFLIGFGSENFLIGFGSVKISDLIWIRHIYWSDPDQAYFLIRFGPGNVLFGFGFGKFSDLIWIRQIFLKDPEHNDPGSKPNRDPDPQLLKLARIQ